MNGQLRFENDYEPWRPFLIDRYPDGYFVFQIGDEAITACRCPLSPSQVQELVDFLTKGGNQ